MFQIICIFLYFEKTEPFLFSGKGIPSTTQHTNIPTPIPFRRDETMNNNRNCRPSSSKGNSFSSALSSMLSSIPGELNLINFLLWCSASRPSSSKGNSTPSTLSSACKTQQHSFWLVSGKFWAMNRPAFSGRILGGRPRTSKHHPRPTNTTHELLLIYLLVNRISSNIDEKWFMVQSSKLMAQDS